ncbi:MAG: prepilin-type N-terminal cleavage/methylation domain-containing protein [Candidatus Omnitrophica bacterium]|nr:prepilin-type N-terminal cleavage/methylation domain-containing protein [Candidatus Omnitrophota bacterium]
MKKGFTLLELIVVIVILGILATLGYTQYTKITEKMRIAEAVANIGKMRKYAIGYYMENGTYTTITAADLGIGSSSDQLPNTCNSSTYFYYQFFFPSPPNIELSAVRCTAGGKQPNYSGGNKYWIYMGLLPSGSGELKCWDSVTGLDLSWCRP